jgi:hypothetical protein
MYRAILVGANGQLGAETFAVDDDGGLGCGARHFRFRIRVVGHGLDLSDVSTLNGSGSLLLGIAPAVLDLDEAGMRRNLPVKECLDFAVITDGVEALVTLYIAEERCVVAASPGASNASSGGRVQG